MSPIRLFPQRVSQDNVESRRKKTPLHFYRDYTLAICECQCPATGFSKFVYKAGCARGGRLSTTHQGGNRASKKT